MSHPAGNPKLSGADRAEPAVSIGTGAALGPAISDRTCTGAMAYCRNRTVRRRSVRTVPIRLGLPVPALGAKAAASAGANDALTTLTIAVLTITVLSVEY